MIDTVMDIEAKFNPAAVIFDMDGLMLDTEKIMFRMRFKAGELYGYNVSGEFVSTLLGKNEEFTRKIFMREFGQDFPYDRYQKDWKRLVHEEFEKGIAHKKGLIVLLDHLGSLKIPFAVATSTHRDIALWRLGKAGLTDRVKVVVCGDEIAQGKPAPDIFLLAAEKLGKAPSECVGFEDSPAGLQAIHAAGMRSVFIKDLAEPPPAVMATVWRSFNDLGEAIALFDIP